MNNEAVVDFLKEIEKFKTCERTCRTTDTTRAESDAEHSWHLATFLLLLEDELPEVDFTRVLKLALIHDLPEIYAGDTNPYRSDLTNKEENEKVAADKLFNMLPSTL
jgi:putative hydrolase of HD superfamily